ncbi:hypothetical protein ACIHFD_49605 [Nonomuraea sp. NPDC051941]|uniref:hypothetical protein n=1 Tax=Nonomuraea sp. NPDC051941 TaxID=3364373 RepID=UPI0037C77418
MSEPGVEVSELAGDGVIVTVEESGGVAVEVAEVTTAVSVALAVPGIQGSPGTPGPRGEQGPAGPEGGAYQTEVVFAVPALVWETEHTLARQPHVTCFTSDGQRVEGDPSYPADNVVRVTWAVPMSGTLRLT